GPLLPWRVGSTRYLLQRLRWPMWAGALTVAGLVLTGVRHWAAVAAFGLAAFVGTATVVEMVRGVRSNRRAFGGGVARAAFGAVGVLIPSLNFYPSSQDPIGTPSISKGTPFNGFHDLYASLQSLAKKGTSATFRLYSNPGVMWLWAGGAVIVLGGVIALWPVR